MSNNTTWDEQHLIDKGFIKDSKGNWYKPEFTNVTVNARKGKVTAETRLHDGSKKYEVQFVDAGISSPKEELKESVLTINGLVAGLNSSNGLMRAHWSKIAKEKEKYCAIVRQQFIEGKLKKHLGKVRVRYIGYKSNFMDWDNFCSSFKLIGDALVKEGIILDDNPKVLVEFSPRMIKCKRIEQRIEVVIQDVDNNYQPTIKEWD